MAENAQNSRERMVENENRSDAVTKLQAAARGWLQRLVWPFRRALIIAQRAGYNAFTGRGWAFDDPGW